MYKVEDKNPIIRLDSIATRCLLQYIGVADVARLCLTSKDVLLKIRKIMLKEMNLDYSDSKLRILRNFH